MKFETQNDDLSDISIERCAHDKANPYTMVHNDLIRDKSISPGCRWLLIYLLANDENVWTIKVSQIINHLKGFAGKNTVYNLFDEAIQAGYIKRHNYLINNLKRTKYIVSEKPKFKKFLRCLKIGEAGAGDPENHDALEGTSKESLSLRKNISKNPPLSSPPEKSVRSKPPKGKSLRSEEEEVPVYKILEQTTLPPKDKKRLSQEFSEAEVERAIKISETQQVKKTLMALLLNILQNPDKWPDAQETQLQTHQQHIAHQYNESLKLSKKLAVEPLIKPGAKTPDKVPCSEVAKANEATIVENHMKIVLNGVITQVSLKSIDFEQDIKNATAQLR